MPTGIYKRTKPVSEETRIKRSISVSRALLGHSVSEETRRKISESKRGQKHTEDTKRKMSLTKKRLGIKPPSPKGKKQTPEHKKKVADFHRGKNLSFEHRKKLSIAHGGMGNQELKRQIRGVLQYAGWRKSIFKRDDYICQICRKRGGDLQIDHYPTTFAEIVRKHNFKNLEEAISCQELWDINNGRTLCIDCHKLTPSYLRNIFPQGNSWMEIDLNPQMGRVPVEAFGVASLPFISQNEDRKFKSNPIDRESLFITTPKQI